MMAELHILVVAGSEGEAGELRESLRGGDLSAVLQHVPALDALASILPEQAWDLAIVCHGPGDASAEPALRVMRERAPHIPCVVVSSVPGVEAVRATMKAGAADYLPRDRLTDLPEALRDAVVRVPTVAAHMVTGWALHELVCDAAGSVVDYRFLAVNRPFEELTGLRAAEVIGHTIRQVLPEIESSWIETYATVVRTGVPVQFERYSGVLKRWYQVVAHRPRPGQFATEFVDITERKRAEEALAESERRYRTLVDEINDGLFVTDAEGRLTFANRALARIHGVGSPDELLGRPFWERIVPAHREGAKADFLRSVEGEEIAPTRTLAIERPDGSTRTIEVRPVPIPSEGRVIGSRGMIRDVTERIRAEAQALRLAQMVRAADDSLVITDATGRIELVNPAFERITGYSAAEVMGRTPRILKSGRHEPAFYESLWETILAGKVFRAVFINRRRSGELYHQEETITPIRDAAGRITHFVSTGRDVTARILLEKGAERSRRLEAVGRLAGGIAHDFNNVLTAIRSFAHFAIESLRAADPAREDVEQIDIAAGRAAELTNQLLAFSRRQPVEPKVVNPAAEIGDIARMLQRLVGDDVDLRLLPTPDDLWNVRIDPGAFEQVLVNLVVNAREAMPEGGALTIEVLNARLDEGQTTRYSEDFPAGEYVLLAVSDTGVGMEAKTRERIFEPFFTTKGPGGGTGLGLATAYGVIRQAGGYIAVYSEPGQGTTFKIYLPRAEGPLEAVAPPLAVDPRGSETVLLAEDDAPVRVLARRALQKYGYRVLEATNGGEALLLSEQHPGPIQLLLTDVVMPKMSGRQLAERLAAIHPTMRVLYMSGYTENAILHHGVLEAGVKFLRKPFGPEALVRRVREVLDEAPQGESGPAPS